MKDDAQLLYIAAGNVRFTEEPDVNEKIIYVYSTRKKSKIGIVPKAGDKRILNSTE